MAIAPKKCRRPAQTISPTDFAGTLAARLGINISSRRRKNNTPD
jgi:hypothetical protein